MNMALTVNVAFSEFIKNFVNLDPNKTETARKSRDNLKNNIHGLGNSDSFFCLASQYDLDFGSFSRKTKIRDLDDIDMMIGLNGSNATYTANTWEDVKINISDNSCQFVNYCDENGYVSSNRIKNKFISELKKLSNYYKAELHARGEAVTLDLYSYDWKFDIVPCFKCRDEDKYVIPNGKGHWKFTNPRIEQERLTQINQKHDGKVLDTIRLIKYWNRRGKMPTMPSYVLETMTLDFFDSVSTTSDWIEQRFYEVMCYIKDNIWNPINDAKGVEGNINTLNYYEKNSIQVRATNDCKKAQDAIIAETSDNDQHKAINIWKDIFGSDFPKYE
jgi:hypothetical protein